MSKHSVFGLAQSKIEASDIVEGLNVAGFSDEDISVLFPDKPGTMDFAGIPEYEAKRYEGKVRDGNILISVQTEDPDDASHARDILEHGGAEDISSTAETAVTADNARNGTGAEDR